VKRESMVILAALGVIPVQALAQEGTAQMQEAVALNPRTIAIVQSLIEGDALYANAEATELRIRNSALGSDMKTALASSGQVKADENTGDFVVNSKFAAALSGSRILHNSTMPKTISDFLLLQKLENDLKTGTREELAAFRSAPFF
jgi:hypothetical protein